MTAMLLQNASGFLLQNAIVLLQNAAFIKKCINFITKCDGCYKMRRLLQNALVQLIINIIKKMSFSFYPEWGVSLLS